MDRRGLVDDTIDELVSSPDLVMCSLLSSFVILQIPDVLRESLWTDEAYSWWVATHQVPELIRVTASDVHPPLYYLLLKVWTLVIGESEPALRSLSVLLMTAAIYLSYVAATKWYDDTVGLLTGLFLVCSTTLYVYAQEARMYALLVLLTVASYLLVDRIRKEWRLSHVVIYSLLTIALVYTHLYGSFVVASQALFVTADWRLGRQDVSLSRLLAPYAVTALAFSPWAVIWLEKLLENNPGGPTGWIVRAEWSYSRLLGYLIRPIPLAVFPLLLFASYVTTRRTEQTGRLPAFRFNLRIENTSRVLLLGTWIAVPVLIALSISVLFREIMYYKFFVFSVVPVMMIAADAVLRMDRPLVRRLLIVLIVVQASVAIYSTYTGPDKQPWKQTYGQLDERADTDDGVFVATGVTQKTYLYYKLEGLTVVEELNEDTRQEYEDIWIVTESTRVPRYNDIDRSCLERVVTSRPRSLVRFEREGDLWASIWRLDCDRMELTS
jgi:4-amino-4-deoxy-L-arabinose transferase-like glycosyltransferase